MNNPFDIPITRRGVLGGMLALGATALVAGCSTPGGGGNGGGGAVGAPFGPTEAPSGTRKTGGRFRFAPQDMDAGIGMDPTSSVGSSWVFSMLMFNSLLGKNHDLSTNMQLVDVFEPEGNDQGTWTIRVKEGIEFHSGKTLGADDVIFTIQHILDPNNPGFASGLMGSIDPNGLTKMDERTLRLKLNFPNSQLKQIFSEAATSILPSDFDINTNFGGTGPFKFQSYTPGQRLVTERNENYFKDVWLDEVELIQYDDAGTARFNALLSGQIDGMNNVTPSLAGQLKGRDDLQMIVSESGAFEPWAMRSGPGDQFEDPNVRKAFKLIANRKLMVESALGGYGAVGNDIGAFAQWDPGVDADLEREQDLDEAKSLLKAAGQENMEVSFRVGEVVPGQLAAAEIFVQEAKKIGVTVKIDKVSDLAQFYAGEDYYTSQMKNDYLFTQSMFSNGTYCWFKDTYFNNTSYYNPEFEDLFKKALSEPEEQGNKTMQEASRLIFEDGPWMVWGRRNTVDGYSSKFTGAQQDAAGNGFNGLKFDEISQV